MPRGGRRTKAPGTPAKSNRTDMNQPAAQAASVNRAPRVRPGIPGTQGLQQTPGAARQAPAAPPGPEPGSFGAMTRSTERPGEPITAGMSMGAGPGPEVLPAPPGGGTALQELRALYGRFPLPEIRDLIEEAMESQRGSL